MSVERAGLAGDDRADHGQPDGAADLERGLHEPGRQALLVVADAAGPGDVERREAQREAEAEQEHGRQELEDVGRRDVDAAQRDRRVARCEGERADRDQPRRAEAVDDRADPRREQRDQQARRQEGQRGLDRRPAVERLQVQRHDELEADVGPEHGHHAEVGAHQRARAQDPEAHERRSGAALDGDEERQQHPAQREGPDRLRGGPALVGGLDDGPHEQEHPGGQRQRPGHVEAPAVERRGPVVRDHARPDREQRERDRHGKQEGPAPAELGQDPAEDEAEREAAGSRRGVDAEGSVALRTLREGRRDDRQAGRSGEGSRRALQEARDDEQGAVVDEPAEGRGDREDAQRDEQGPAPAEEIGGPPAEQQQSAVTEHVAGHDPLQLRGREVQVGVDRGKGDADHRDVEPVEEQHAAQDDEQEVGGGDAGEHPERIHADA